MLNSADSTTPTFRERKGWSLLNSTSAGRLDPLVDLHSSGSANRSSSLATQAQVLNGSLPDKEQLALLEQAPSVLASKSSNTGSLAVVFYSSLASEVVYCLVSAGTTLFNKHALSSYNFPAPNTLLLFQFVLAVGLLQVLHITGFITLQPLRLDIAKIWLPVNIIFVAMNVTGFYALQAVGAGMFTVLKNLSNLMTIAGDYIIFGHTYSWQVWGCLGLMILSAFMGGWTDAQFNMKGYAWQLVNCLFTAAYSLYLSGVIRSLSSSQQGKQAVGEMSMVYYNNLMSVPALALMSLASGEMNVLGQAKQIRDPGFQVVAVLGGLMGFGVSFASIWCMSRTSATIYSLTGSMNKVVVALVGMWFFHERTSMANLGSIAVGLAAGFLFVFAKSKGPGGKPAATTSSGGQSGADEEAPLLPLKSKNSDAGNQTLGGSGVKSKSSDGGTPQLIVRTSNGGAR